ncbi:hypothetical protein BG004_005069 [Podila humilis]|nr:hypothetical protein BG004_005069 [Podila humilis]
MPVRNLDYYTTQKNLITTNQPLSTLKDIRLGIDANVWLKRVISSSASEQYISGIGGAPSCMRKAIEKELEGFKANSIHPLFVFSGLSLIRKDKPHVNDDQKMAKRTAAWDAVNSSKIEMALSYWTSSYSVQQPDLVHLVIRILKEHNVDYIRAPYGAGPQLVYMERHPKQIIHAIHGGSELLMFDVDRVITSLDFTKQTFGFISKKAILQDLHFTDDQFLDMCILSGFDLCPTFPPLAEDGGFLFKNVQDLLRQHRTGFNAVKAHADSPVMVKSSYVDTFCRTRCAMKYQPILTDEGQVEPMNKDEAPSDIHEFIGCRLPDQVYYFLSRGVLGESTLNTLLWGHVAEYSPLCNGETEEYRTFLTTELLKIKSQTLVLAQAQLHSFYHRKVAITYWYDSSASAEHVMKLDSAQADVEPIGRWKTGKLLVEKELKKQGISSPSYSFSLGLLSNPSEASATISAQQRNQEKVAPLAGMANIQSRHLSKLLHLRSFIETATHSPSAFGKAVIGAFKAHPTASLSAETQDGLFIALELIRAELLTARPYSVTYTKKQVVEDEVAIKAIRLVSRTASLIGARFKGIKSWAGPVNRDLLAFNSVSKALTRHLRHLSESLMLEMLLSDEIQKDDLNFAELAVHMPFAGEHSTVMGVLVKEYLESQAMDPKLTKEQAVHAVEEKLGATSLSSLAESVKAELQRGFAFWDVVVDAVKALGASSLSSSSSSSPSTSSSSNGVNKALLQEFTDANNWVKSRKI